MSILRAMFGPSREEVWRRLAADTGARYEDGGPWKPDRVSVEVGEWTVTLDTFHADKAVYTRLRAPFVNPDGFRFSLHRRAVFDRLGELFGLRDAQTGHPGFDEAFAIRGTDEGKVRRLFDNRRLRELLEAQPAVHLEVKDDEGWFGRRFPEGVDELYFRTPGVVRDGARLKALFDLFAETLHTLCHIGSAYESDPGLRL